MGANNNQDRTQDPLCDVPMHAGRERGTHEMERKSTPAWKRIAKRFGIEPNERAVQAFLLRGAYRAPITDRDREWIAKQLAEGSARTLGERLPRRSVKK